MAQDDNGNSQQEALQTILLEGIKEQRRSRRWRIFFRFAWIGIIIIAIFALRPGHSKDYYSRNLPHAALIKISGTIMPGVSTSAENINKSLNSAFSDENATGILLQINSPGGSPVQAGEVYDNIMRLRKKYPKKKVYAVCTDMCASGAYYIAAAANDVYVDKASLVGSIGVLMNGFGFVDTLKKVGATRRLITAGSEKGFMDPFSPVKESDVKYMHKMLGIIHQQFINSVKKGRGKRLKLDTPLLFSGLVWTGQQAVQIGLADGLGSPTEVARDVIKTKNIVDYTQQQSLFSKFSAKVGAEFADSVTTHLGIPASGLQ